MKKLHPDRDLSSLLVGKLLKGANKFLELYHTTHLEETKTATYVDPLKVVNAKKAKS